MEILYFILKKFIVWDVAEFKNVYFSFLYFSAKKINKHSENYRVYYNFDTTQFFLPSLLIRLGNVTLIVLLCCKADSGSWSSGSRMANHNHVLLLTLSCRHGSNSLDTSTRDRKTKHNTNTNTINKTQNDRFANSPDQQQFALSYSEFDSHM